MSSSKEDGAETVEATADDSSRQQGPVGFQEAEEQANAGSGWGQHWSEACSYMGEGYMGGPMMGGDCMQWQQMGMHGEQPVFAGTVMMPAEMPAEQQPEGSKSEDQKQVPLPPEWANCFTVMMRNLPNRYTQLMLLEEISSAGFAGTFDFLYLPIDPDTHANKGYAFINFVDPIQAWRFKGTYEGQQMKCFNSSKFVSVNPAALQGLEANYAHYSTARCSYGNPSTRPLFFREPAQSYMAYAAPRWGGYGRRNNGNSLVDEAAQRTELTQQDAPPQPQPKPQPKAPAEQPPQKRFCPYCGGAIRPNYRFCKYCGSSLEGLEGLLQASDS